MTVAPPPPALVLGRLADEDRLHVLAAVSLGATDLATVAADAGVSTETAARALAHLAGVGLIVDSDAGLRVDLSVFADAARAASAPRRRPDLRPITPEQERVVRNFVDESGRLRALPAREARRRVVLEWVIGRFDSTRSYTEREVNSVLLPLYDDVASLRRFLVDDGLLRRDRGSYEVARPAADR